MNDFHEIGRLPTPQDNCAIAVRDLAAGTAVSHHNSHFTLNYPVLVGHRFAVQPIAEGEPLLSWGMPFGRALRDIAAGEYVFNEKARNELNSRSLGFTLPSAPNFADDLNLYEFDAAQFQPAPPLPRKPNHQTFMGIQRPGNRGVGTRNAIVLLGVNALVAGFVQQLEKELKPLVQDYAHINDIVAVAHTEGSQAGNNNQELLLRTLAGYMVHPNVGAVLIVDAGDVGVTNKMLGEYAQHHAYPLADVQHRFMSMQGSFTADLEMGKTIVESWLPQVNVMRRTPQPLSELKIALQCGGSDSFSGISGNPLAAWTAKELMQLGGTAVLAETDELLGAESYILQKVRDAATAERFLQTLARFQERTAWHGYSAKSNPSGGNVYRGLYNIYLKSLGAAAKKHPDVRLEGVLAYGERVPAAGYFFMDSPGNDLESIAGQVATGCNLIYFVTGNGSITNFPFVPTIKIVTTTDRYRLLTDEMDVNAGTYLDGTPLPELGEKLLGLSADVASGKLSAGEKAHHAQVQIWRNWQLSEWVDLDEIKSKPQPDGHPLPVPTPDRIVETTYSAWLTKTGPSTDRIGLILPTSLCSSQIAQLAVQRLNKLGIGKEKAISRFVALPHTEGCGSPTQQTFVNTILGHATHPMVATCLMLEHGCEMAHNDFWRQHMQARGIDSTQFGWASVQLDGGIERVLSKIEAWSVTACGRLVTPRVVTVDFSKLRLGMMSEGDADEETAVSLANLIQQIAGAGGTVIVPANDPLAANTAFAKELRIDPNPKPTLAFVSQVEHPSVHLMETPSTQWSETISGLGATGVEVILAVVTSRSQSGHPFIPVLQVVGETAVFQPFHADADLILSGSGQQRLAQLRLQLSAVLSNTMAPKLSQKGFVGFQITRGQLGVSL